MLLYVCKNKVSDRFPAAADFRHEPLSTNSDPIVNPGVSFVNPLIWLTLPLSGRHGDWDGEANILWRPVHSRGLLDSWNDEF
jgi:hypothetical protein